MAWVVLTAKDWVTWTAAAYVALPPWSAAIVQVPGPTRVTVDLTTVQTAVVVLVIVTAKPDVAVAETE
ncbi:hypothetical protein [Terrabacter terrae]